MPRTPVIYNRTSQIQKNVSIAAGIAFLLMLNSPTHAQEQRVLGIDVSAWQGEISAASWATFKRATNEQVNGVFGDGRDFVFIRSSRGGTTGYYNQNDSDNSNGQNTLSQRYDDPYFVQNITRATAAGLLAGPYHFARPDIVESTFNSGGIANNGADEADHMIQMAGAWMRPGYLLPVFDLEAGNNRTRTELAQFCIDFSDRIYERAGVRPVMYINGSYSTYVDTAANAAELVRKYPVLWVARYANQADPNSIPVQTGHPKDTYSAFYGPWDNPPLPAQPWSFWQYASTAKLNGNKNGTANTDVNVAQGGMEFIRDRMVPALWTGGTNGNWITLTNWNSGQTPVAPVQGPGQVPRVGTLVLPTTRLPNTNDIVILKRDDLNVVASLTSGSHSIRKLYVHETLNVTGASLNVGYVPSWDSTPISAQFAGPVFLGSGANFGVHTLQVDATNSLTVSNATFKFNTLALNRGTTPASLVVTGSMIFSAFSGNTGVITNGLGSGNAGQVNLSGASRFVDVATSHNLHVFVPVVNGGLGKLGAGTLNLSAASTYAGGTTVTAGKLLVHNTSGSATGTGTVTVNGGVLGGTGIISGAVTVNSAGTISPADGSIGTLTLNTPPTLSGTNLMQINRSTSPNADKLVVNGGTLTYGGRLVVANVGPALTGGEVFTLFTAGSYAGMFSSVEMPPLAAGLSWYLGDLNVNGTIKVNRNPIGGLLTLTNTPSLQLEIPKAATLSVVSDPDGDPVTLLGYAIKSTNNASISSSGDKFIYTASVNVPDQFHIIVQDSRGGTSTSLVRVAALTVGTFRQAPTIGVSSTTLHFAGASGSTYFLERSTNLTAWETIATNVMPSSGVFDYEDLFPDFAQRPPAAFYRLRE